MAKDNKKKPSNGNGTEKSPKKRVPWNKGKKMPPKNAVDDHKVKIRVVEDSKKESSGDNNNTAEVLTGLLAKKFLKDVASNKPSCIAIDGAKYYSAEKLESLEKDYKQCISDVKEFFVATEDILVDNLRKRLDLVWDFNKLMDRKNIWRSIALGLAGALILALFILQPSANQTADASASPAASEQSAR